MEKDLGGRIHIEVGRGIRENVNLSQDFSSLSSPHGFISSGENLYKNLKKGFAHRNLCVRLWW